MCINKSGSNTVMVRSRYGYKAVTRINETFLKGGGKIKEILE